MADARPTDTDVLRTDKAADADEAPETDASLAADAAFDNEVGDYPDDDERSLGFGLNLSFQSRLTIGLIAAAVLPLAGFGLVVLLIGSPAADPTLGRILLFPAGTATPVGHLLAYLLAADLTG